MRAALRGHSRRMRTNPARRTVQWAVAAALVVVTAGCGDDADTAAHRAATRLLGPPRAPTATRLASGRFTRWMPFDETDPAAFRSTGPTSAFEKAAIDTAPDEIKDDWERKIEAESAMFNRCSRSTTSIWLRSRSPARRRSRRPSKPRRTSRPRRPGSSPTRARSVARSSPSRLTSRTRARSRDIL